MDIKLNNPTEDTIKMIMRSWPPGYCFYYKGNSQEIILHCDKYLDDFKGQTRIFNYHDNYINITMTLPYHECPSVTVFKGGI